MQPAIVLHSTFTIQHSTFNISSLHAVHQPAAGKPRPLQPPPDVWIRPHDLPYESRPVILDHRNDRSLVDAEVVVVDPGDAGDDVTHLHLRVEVQCWVERVDEAVLLI